VLDCCKGGATRPGTVGPSNHHPTLATEIPSPLYLSFSSIISPHHQTRLLLSGPVERWAGSPWFHTVLLTPTTTTHHLCNTTTMYQPRGAATTPDATRHHHRCKIQPPKRITRRQWCRMCGVELTVGTRLPIRSSRASVTLLGGDCWFPMMSYRRTPDLDIIKLDQHSDRNQRDTTQH
jgi:hypothetical protein